VTHVTCDRCRQDIRPGDVRAARITNLTDSTMSFVKGFNHDPSSLAPRQFYLGDTSAVI
jgi:hypothetical protein